MPKSTKKARKRDARKSQEKGQMVSFCYFSGTKDMVFTELSFIFTKYQNI